MGLEELIPLLIKYVVIPETARLVRGNPQITDEQIIAQLPEDVRVLCLNNQPFLDSIRGSAGMAGKG